MRLTDSTRFPSPVLRETGNDYSSGHFDVLLEVEERPASGALTLRHKIELSEPSIAALVREGIAAVGAYIRCNDTYFNQLREMGWPTGVSDFEPGSLLNRVTVRPVIWAKEDIPSWGAETIHPEFEPPVALPRGRILAIAPEYVISVGIAKFAPMESIFELSASSDIPNGLIRVNPDGERIAILVSDAMFQAINTLRGQSHGQAFLMTSVYLPAVIDVLEAVRTDTAQFSGRRWHQPFMAKCDVRGIDVSAKGSLLEPAQQLLDLPARAIISMAAEGEQ